VTRGARRARGICVLVDVGPGSDLLDEVKVVVDELFKALRSYSYGRDMGQDMLLIKRASALRARLGSH
jgi:hypothetical protein